MASATHAQAATIADAPGTRVRARPRRKARPRARGGILWITVGGILLAGVVFVNVAVLQLNLRLDTANSDRVKLQAQTAALQAQYSELVASPRVSAAATKELGLVYQNPMEYGHVNLAPK